MSQDRKHFWKIAAGIFLCCGLLASLLTLYYWYQYGRTLQRFESTTVRLSVIFDYGNGSIHRKQHRDTLSLAADSLLSVTVRLAKVKYDVYPIGVLVVSIDGVANTMTVAWLWYRWNQQSKSWLHGETGPDKFFPRNDDIVI